MGIYKYFDTYWSQNYVKKKRQLEDRVAIWVQSVASESILSIWDRVYRPGFTNAALGSG